MPPQSTWNPVIVVRQQGSIEENIFLCLLFSALEGTPNVRALSTLTSGLMVRQEQGYPLFAIWPLNLNK